MGQGSDVAMLVNVGIAQHMGAAGAVAVPRDRPAGGGRA